MREGSPVADFVMYCFMMMSAQTHQVISGVRTALRDRFNMVDFLHRSIPSFLQAHLAERVFFYVAVTDSLPCPAVFFVDVRAPLKTIIPSTLLFSVLRTVCFSIFSQTWTAGKAAGTAG